MIPIDDDCREIKEWIEGYPRFKPRFWTVYRVIICGLHRENGALPEWSGMTAGTVPDAIRTIEKYSTERETRFNWAEDPSGNPVGS